MNIVPKQIYALIFSVAIVAPMHGMENNVAGIDIIEQQIITDAATSVWYKKPSVQAVAALTAAVGIAFVLRKGKMAVAAIVATLFAVKLSQTNTVEADQLPVVVPHQTDELSHADVQHDEQLVEVFVLPAQNTQADTLEAQIEDKLTKVTAAWNKGKGAVIHTLNQDIAIQITNDVYQQHDDLNNK